MLELCESNTFSISFDPNDSESHFGSVAFDIKVELNGPSHHSTLIINRCWISFDDLNTFEFELHQLIKEETQEIALCNLSESPILTIEKTKKRIVIRVCASDVDSCNQTIIESHEDSSDLLEMMLQRLRDYPKWW